ncbi:MAG: histidine phosphatase family protein, partial [Chloroflexota bacterium]
GSRGVPARYSGFETVVEVDPDLMEWDYGADEGRTSEQIRAERPDWTIWNTGPLDGESVDSVGSRVDRVIAAALSRRGDTLAFAHGHVLRVLAARWIGLPPAAGGSFALGTATVSILGWDGEAPVIRRWNVGDGLD